MVKASELLGIGQSSGGSCGNLQLQTVRSNSSVTQGQRIWFTPGVGIESTQGTITDTFRLDVATSGGVTIFDPAGLAQRYSLRLAPNGLSGFLLYENRALYKVTLSSAYNLSTMSATLITSDVSTSYGIVGGSQIDAIYGNSGTRLYILAGTTVSTLSLSVAYDVNSTVTNLSQTLTVGGTPTGGLAITPNGLNICVENSAVAGAILSYTLSSAWNVTTAGSSTSVTLPSFTGQVTGVSIASNGLNVFMCNGTNTIRSYILTSANSLTGGSTFAFSKTSSITGSGTSRVELMGNNSSVFITRQHRYDNFSSMDVILPNTNSAVIGFSTATVAALTNFQGLINFSTSLEWLGALVGDTLNLGATSLVKNGSGPIVGICVETNKFILIDETNDNAATLYSNAEIIEVTINSSEVTWVNKTGSGYLKGITLPDSTGSINSIKLTIDGGTEYEVLTTGNIDLSTNKAGSLLPLEVSYKRSLVLKTTSSATGPQANVILYNKVAGF
jgi:hypothetical protein